MPKHITFALENFYPDYRAGTETYVYNLAKGLIKYNWQVSVIIAAVGKESYEYEYEGIHVYTFSVPKKLNTRELNGLENPTGIEEFKELLQQLKPDIFHLHSLSRSLHAEHLKIASELGINTVFTSHLGGNFCAHGDLLLFGKKQCEGKVKMHRCLSCFINKQRKISKPVSQVLAFFINKFIIKTYFIKLFPALRIVEYKLEQLELLKINTDFFIAIAGWLNQIYLQNGFINTHLINQGISSDFKKKSPSLKSTKAKIQLIFVGRMHPLKNIEIVLDALKSLKEHFNLTVITIPFEDEMEYYEQIKSRFINLNFTDWFENLSNIEVAEKLDQSGILILPSKFEVAPLVILEAFAKKLPVLGSDYIAIKEMVQHNVNGLIFKNGVTNSLKEQLQRIIDEPDLLGKLSKNIETPRTFYDVADDMDKIYKKLI